MRYGLLLMFVLRTEVVNIHAYILSCSNIMNNKVFYQHPNLMRALGMHETVMEVMVNVLGGGGDSKVTQRNDIEKIFLGSMYFF